MYTRPIVVFEEIIYSRFLRIERALDDDCDVFSGVFQSIVVESTPGDRPLKNDAAYSIIKSRILLPRGD